MAEVRPSACVAVLALVLTVALATAPPALGGIPGNNGWLVFDSRRGGDADLYRIAPAAGAAEKRLDASHPTAEDARPAWAPEADMSVRMTEFTDTTVSIGGDGFRDIAYVMIGGRLAPSFAVTSPGGIVATLPEPRDGDDVCVAKYAGLAAAPHMLERVTRSLGTGSFVSECVSQPIAFQSNRSGDYEIWVYDPSLPAGAANPVNLTRFPGAHDTAPAWSSDRGGSTEPRLEVRDRSLLAFESDRYGSRDIFVLDPSKPLSAVPGAPNPVRLTTSPADDANPEWSPDGRHVVFESTRSGMRDLWSVAVPDVPLGPEPGLAHLTADTLPSYEPTWSVTDSGGIGLSGSVLAFSGPEEAGGSCELNVLKWPNTSGLPPSDTVPTTVVREASRDDAPALSAKGEAIAFQSAEGGAEHLYVLDSDGVEETPGEIATRVTSTPGVHRHPSWQPLYLSADLGYYRPLGRRSKRRKRRGAGVVTRTAAAVGAPCAEPPRPTFTVTPATPAVGQPVRLDASASRDAEGPIQRYEWDLDGDGRFERTGSAAVVSRTFTTRGDHPVALRVLDEDGAAQRVRKLVSVVEKSVPPSRCTHLGTPGDDVLRGTRGADVLCGRGGDDVILGRGGNDRAFGGPGDDRMNGGRGNDRMSGGSGRDRLDGAAGRDDLAGGRGRDRLRGGGGRDALHGGGAGDDLRAVDRRPDLVRGGRGEDRARADRKLDVLRGVEDVIRR